MESAYDLKDLGKRLKEKGLVELEDGAEAIVKELFAWLRESAIMSPNIYDDMAMIVYPKIEEMILSQVDKIDGKVAE